LEELRKVAHLPRGRCPVKDRRDFGYNFKWQVAGRIGRLLPKKRRPSIEDPVQISGLPASALSSSGMAHSCPASENETNPVNDGDAVAVEVPHGDALEDQTYGIAFRGLKGAVPVTEQHAHVRRGR
jgi:hypothetical protein